MQAVLIRPVLSARAWHRSSLASMQDPHLAYKLVNAKRDLSVHIDLRRLPRMVALFLVGMRPAPEQKGQQHQVAVAVEGVVVP